MSSYEGLKFYIFVTIFESFVFSVKEFEKYLSSFDLTLKDVKKKINIETSWNQLIYERYRDQIKINIPNLKKKIELQRSSENKKSYRLSEIVFEKKDDVAIAVKGELNEAMKNYGFDIIKTLVTDIDPDAQVKESMNRINASEREKVAAQFEGDAQRILIVERAKAEAESKRLQGQGIADQRREIARGLEDSVKVLNGVDINSQEASALIVVTQHYDTLQSVGSASNSNLILMPNSPQAGSEMLNNMVASFTASNQIGEEMKKARKEKEQNKE